MGRRNEVAKKGSAKKGSAKKEKASREADKKKRRIDDEAGPSKLPGYEEESDDSDYEVEEMQYEKVKFSYSAVVSLRKALASEEEKNRKKVVYLQIVPKSVTQETFYKLNWLKFDTYSGDDGRSVSLNCVDDPMMDHDKTCSPRSLPDLYYYGCTVWNSTVIIGGGMWCIENPSDIVFTYDTIAEKWDVLPRMIARRPGYPTFVVADDKLFVFGGSPQHSRISNASDAEYDNERAKLLGEYCDLKSESPSWKLFDKLPPTECLDYDPLCFNQVYTNGHQILFWIPFNRIVSFNYSTWEWESFEGPYELGKGIRWSGDVVIIDHFLFWHDYGEIYARDLMEGPKGTTMSVYKFKDACEIFGPVSFCGGDDPDYRLTYLFHVGNHELCLIWSTEKNILRYNTFMIRTSMGGGVARLHLVSGRAGSLETPLNYIEHALEVSS